MICQCSTKRREWNRFIFCILAEHVLEVLIDYNTKAELLTNDAPM
jgi:hypothetical protein